MSSATVVINAYFLWDHLAHPGYFKPALVPWGGGVGWGAYAASQTIVLHMKRLSQTESPSFVILCVLCFQRQSFLTFNAYAKTERQDQ